MADPMSPIDTINRLRALATLAAFVCCKLLTIGSAAADACPPALAEARRLIVVEAETINGLKASISTFTRDGPDTGWTPEKARTPAVVGLAGLAWGWPYRHLAASGEPIKQEGDKRTPIGIFRLGPAFGHAPASLPGYLRLNSSQHYCVDDARSPHYSQIVPRSAAGPGMSGEDMATIDLYRRGIVVDYPTDRAAKAGSCIFLHLWRSHAKGTTGCVALPEEVLASLQAWVATGATAVAIFPQNARARFGACLPR